MNTDKTNSISPSDIDASCRVPLLALFGGAALWLVLGLLLGLAAAMSFHAPDIFANYASLSYGRAQAAANDLLLYGFAIPAGLGVTLWIFARLSQAPLALPIVPIAAANLWHLGVFIGTAAILLGHSTGYTWLEYPRVPAVLLFAAFLLVAVSATATMGFRADRDLYPSHWFLFAALLWFAWAYSSANMFLLSGHPPRGVVQAIIGWWFANNLIFVGLALAGIGVAFYFLPKFAGQPLASSGYTLFAFSTLICFGAWCGIPQSAPVPAWLPATSAFAALLSFIPILAIAIIAWKTASPAGFSLNGGPFCFVKFGTVSFVASAFLYLAEFCPRYSRAVDFTWFGFGVTQWQLLGFAGMIFCGAIYHILPLVMQKELPFPRLARGTFFFFGAGVLIYVIPLLVGGVEQGLKLRHFNIAFAEANAAAVMFLRVSTLGQVSMLVGTLFLLLNVLVMTIRWKVGLAKAAWRAVTSPLESPAERPNTEVTP
ncbi:MAG TPA: cbb3-type cytochrome c oxidase subunit I [Candidatus Acidoferrales bacterium]|nr:cbb3-type cytochrome c oxidase subunit I [Candidatus Acidoferrales bacterium]